MAHLVCPTIGAKRDFGDRGKFSHSVGVARGMRGELLPDTVLEVRWLLRESAHTDRIVSYLGAVA